MLAAYDRDDSIFLSSAILGLLLGPVSFALSFWIAKQVHKDEGKRVALTIVLGSIFLTAGLIATAAGWMVAVFR